MSYLLNISDILDKFLSDYISENKIPGISFGITLHSKLLQFKSSGYSNILSKSSITPKTLFRCASITKGFTSLMMIQLQKKGLLSFEDSLQSILKDTIPDNCSLQKDFSEIPLRSLASHSSGLPLEGDFDRWSDEKPIMADYETIIKGLNINKIANVYEKFQYSNIGYILLGIALEKIAKKKYDDYIKENILIPLKMNNSGFHFNQKENEENEATGYIYKDDEIIESSKNGYGDCKSCGGLITNTIDLMKYLDFIQSDISCNIMKNPVIMYKPEKNNSKFKERAYGLGLSIGDYDNEFQTISHSGGTWGFTSYFIIIPNLNLKCIIWYNSDKKGIKIILEKILDLFIPVIKNNLNPDCKEINYSEIVLNKKNTKRLCYFHNKGTKIRIFEPKNELSYNIMDIFESNGRYTKGIQLIRVSYSLTDYFIKEGPNEKERVFLIYDSQENKYPSKIKFQGGLYFYIY